MAAVGSINISVTKTNWKNRVICSSTSAALDCAVICENDGGWIERRALYMCFFAMSAKSSAGSSRGFSYAHLGNE
jgi:hypothetical protein